ncbi:MAG: transcriptional repressor [Clostridia bacterium]|nr:transcriptional repressor [Clostridia bacterium]
MSQTRNTLQRELVREAMNENYTHPTAEEIYENIHDKYPHISFATVYRNLNLLADHGEILRLHLPEGPDHYDFTVKPHYHFLCRKCHNIVDSDIPYTHSLDHISPEGCVAESHVLTIIGLCKDCLTPEQN